MPFSNAFNFDPAVYDAGMRYVDYPWTPSSTLMAQNEYAHGLYLNERYGLSNPTSSTPSSNDSVSLSDVLSAAKDKLSAAKDKLLDQVVPNSPNSYIYDPAPVANSIEYFDAPYAEKYGMSAETAYQEALANTAHQREMADLKAAGLNPVLTATRGSGADAFAGSAMHASSGAGSYGSSGSSAKGFLASLVGSSVALYTRSNVAGNAAANLVSLFENQV